MQPIRLAFEGDFACFTRPEFAAERVSYEVPPPAAARGMVEAIFWKPQVRYVVLSVAKLPHRSGRVTRFARMTTNEVAPMTPCDVSMQANRAQRRCYILRDAAFLVEVAIQPSGQPITKPGHCLTTYHEILTRRARKGQCVETPCLGLRDYPADFWLATESDVPVTETRPLGPMTYLAWHAGNWPHGAARERVTQNAMMLDGVVDMREWPQ
jgi:CRISPR-associated protein Cas5d